jgi:hypothetical protein
MPAAPPAPGVATFRAAAMSEGKDPDQAVQEARTKVSRMQCGHLVLLGRGITILLLHDNTCEAFHFLTSGARSVCMSVSRKSILAPPRFPSPVPPVQTRGR